MYSRVLQCVVQNKSPMYAVNEPCRSRKSPVNRQRALCTTKKSSSYFPKEPFDSLTHAHVESTTHTHAHTYTHTHVYTSHHRHSLTKPHTHSPKICAHNTLQHATTHCNTLQHRSRQCIHTHCIYTTQKYVALTVAQGFGIHYVHTLHTKRS